MNLSVKQRNILIFGSILLIILGSTFAYLQISKSEEKKGNTKPATSTTADSKPAAPDTSSGNSQIPTPSQGTVVNKQVVNAQPGTQGTQSSPSGNQSQLGTQGAQSTPAANNTQGAQSTQSSPSGNQTQPSAQGSVVNTQVVNTQTGAQNTQSSPSGNQTKPGAQNTQSSPSGNQTQPGAQSTQSSPSVNQTQPGAQGSQSTPAANNSQTGAQGDQSTPAANNSQTGAQGDQSTPAANNTQTGTQNTQSNQVDNTQTGTQNPPSTPTEGQTEVTREAQKYVAISKDERYRLITSENLINRIEEYKNKLEKDEENPGWLFMDKIEEMSNGKSIGDLTTMEFIEALLATKRHYIRAEMETCDADEVEDPDYRWRGKEARLLGDIGVAMPVKIFDAGQWGKNELGELVIPTVHQTPFNGYLMYIPGALLAPDSNVDIPQVFNNGSKDVKDFNPEKYFELYERRLLPMLVFANEEAKAKGKNAIVTVPGIGCGCFAGDMKGKLEEHFSDVLESLLDKYASILPNISLVYFGEHLTTTNRYKEFGKLKYRAIGSKHVQYKNLLDDPAFFNFGDGENYKEHLLFAFVAWDHLSLPGNDFFFMNTRWTDDGAKAAATDSMSVLLGIDGYYNNGLNVYLPMTDESKVWGDLAKNQGTTLDPHNRLYVLKSDDENNLKLEKYEEKNTATNAADHAESGAEALNQNKLTQNTSTTPTEGQQEPAPEDASKKEYVAISENERYRLITSENLIKRIEEYKKILEAGEEKPGKKLSAKIKDMFKGKSIKELTTMEFIKALLATKIPCIPAEWESCDADEVENPIKRWREKEARLLGDIGVAMPVTIFDAGQWGKNELGKPVIPTVHQTPFNGYLMYIPGALLSSKSNVDIPQVFDNGSKDVKDFNPEKYFELYERRLLPMLVFANEEAKAKHKKAIVTVPGIGCGCFAGVMKGKLEEHFSDVLESLLDKYASILPNISLVYFGQHKTGTYNLEKFGDLQYRVIGSSLGEYKHLLADPKEFSFIDGTDYSKHLLFAFVAWDHLSLPGNDFFLPQNRDTDDGAKAAATDSMKVLLGVEGQYNNFYKQYSPPVEYNSWGAVAEKLDFKLDPHNRLHVLKSDAGNNLKLEKYEEKK